MNTRNTLNINSLYDSLARQLRDLDTDYSDDRFTYLDDPFALVAHGRIPTGMRVG